MNITVNVATVSMALPTGTTAAGIKVSITDTKGEPVADTNGTAIAPVVLTSAPYSASFVAVPVGSFVAVAAAVDTLGAVIGTLVSQPFTVPAPVADPAYDAPTTLTVTLQS